MKRKDKVQDNVQEAVEVGHPTGHSTLRANLLAALICILAALLIWVCVMNTADTDYIPLRVKAPQAGYTYEISVDSVKVEGTVSALKGLSEIGVLLPSTEPGVYPLEASHLLLPEGVHLSGDLNATVTVKADG